MSHRFADISGAFFSFLATVFYVRADFLAWPAGMIATSINMVLYYRTGLYADMGKESIYFLSMFYGWYIWMKGGPGESEKAIANLTWALAKKLIAIMIVGTFVLMWILMRWTNSQVPFWDASTTAVSLTAQWLMCQKIIESWILWFIVDLAYVGLYFLKHLPWHGGLFCIYLGLSIVGWWHWSVLRDKLEPVEMHSEKGDGAIANRG